jgi:hypothetical protein
MQIFSDPKTQALCFVMAACAVGSYVLDNRSAHLSADHAAAVITAPMAPVESQAYAFPVVPATGLHTGP